MSKCFCLLINLECKAILLYGGCVSSALYSLIGSNLKKRIHYERSHAFPLSHRIRYKIGCAFSSE